MALRHWLLVLAAVGLLASSIAGTGATGVTADRGTSVAVAPPEDAYLGLGVPPVEPVIAPGTGVTLFEVTNRFDAMLTLVVSVTESDPAGGPSVTAVTVTSPLGPGANAPVTADLACNTAGTESVTVSFTATGDGVRVEGASRVVTLTCTGT